MQKYNLSDVSARHHIVRNSHFHFTFKLYIIHLCMLTRKKMSAITVCQNGCYCFPYDKHVREEERIQCEGNRKECEGY